MDTQSGFIIDLVEHCAKSYPLNVAIIDADYENGKSINYNEMWERVCKLSFIIRQHLSSEIINDNHEMTPLVSIMMNRGIGSIICILAVLKAGAAYVPVDPSFPADRQEYIFTHSKSQLLLVDETNFPAVQLMGPLPPVIIIDAKTGFASNIEKQNNQSSFDSNEINTKIQRFASELTLAYVLYTRYVHVKLKNLSLNIVFLKCIYYCKLVVVVLVNQKALWYKAKVYVTSFNSSPTILKLLQLTEFSD